MLDQIADIATTERKTMSYPALMRLAYIAEAVNDMIYAVNDESRSMLADIASRMSLKPLTAAVSINGQLWVSRDALFTMTLPTFTQVI